MNHEWRCLRRVLRLRSLADWIAQSAERGTLRQPAGGAHVWRIDESNVDQVRAEMIKTGLLIAYPQASA